MHSANKIHLRYWDHPGIGQIVRYLLEYMNMPYEDTRYDFKNNKKQWFEVDKPQLLLKTNFPGLPMIEDGEVILSELSVITTYLAERGNKPELNGIGFDRFRVEQMKSLMCDLTSCAYYATLEDTETKTKRFKEQVLPKLNLVASFLKKTKDFCFGYITIADFYVYCCIKFIMENYLEIFNTQFGKTFDPLLTAFENLPRIQSYIKSDKHMNYEIPVPPQTV